MFHIAFLASTKYHHPALSVLPTSFSALCLPFLFPHFRGLEERRQNSISSVPDAGGASTAGDLPLPLCFSLSPSLSLSSFSGEWERKRGNRERKKEGMQSRASERERQRHRLLLLLSALEMKTICIIHRSAAKEAFAPPPRRLDQ